MNPLGTAVWQAICARIARSLMILTDVHEGQPPRPATVATGTLFLTPAGRPVVLTAAHNLGRERIFLCHGIATGPGRALPDVGAAHLKHPELDIGVMAIADEHAELLRPLALTADSVAEAPDLSMIAILAVAGVPAEFHRAPEEPQGNHHFGAMVFGLTTPQVTRDERSFLKIPWTDAIWGKDAETYGYAPGVSAPLPHPVGVSGGPVWRFTGTGSKLWTAQQGRVVGVAISWNEREQCEFAIPSDLWRDWFLDALELIDRDLATPAAPAPLP